MSLTTEPGKRGDPQPKRMYLKSFFTSLSGTEESFLRVFDKLLAILLLLFFLPLFVVVMVAILVLDGRPVFFSQWRVGQHGRLFKCYKFRSMITDADNSLAKILESDETTQEEWRLRQKLMNDPRISRVGGFLRKTSFDELPQFWNVIKGDMAMVGPRPIVPDEMVRYGNRLGAYLSVRPGITGLWQVSGRSLATYEERVRMDCEYVEGRNLWWNLRIMAKTVWVVLRRSGAE